MSELTPRGEKDDSIWGVVEGFYGRPWTTEQRHDLFKRLRENGLNSYLYAPKDDEKHRAKWRELYTESECDLLRSLIEAATTCGIRFIYALSPGVDITYSDKNEIQMVKEKLRQVQQLGCNAFALLYDDILAEMRPADRDEYDSFADAQVSLTNECYTFLGEPSFSFCPTEYRGNVGLLTNQYLQTVGPAVVSRTITEDHLKTVGQVLNRKPLIWDNLHANDYDPRRVFLGPFFGRSVHIKKLISGLLLNPNCQYEANYLPLYTLGEWNQASEDIDVAQCDGHLPKITYDPEKAIARGIAKWVHVFNGNIGPPIPPISSVESQVTPIFDAAVLSNAVPPISIRTCEGNEMLPPEATDLPAPVYTSSIGTATTVTVQAFPINQSVMNVADAHNLPTIVNSLSVDYSEPMEIYPKDEEQSSPMEIYEHLKHPLTQQAQKSYIRDPIGVNFVDSKKAINIFIDFYYLPFNIGENGLKMLKDFQWLHEHANIMGKNIPFENIGAKEEWKKKAEWIADLVHTITQFYVDLLEAPNRSLAQELFPFVYEMHSIMSVLKGVLEWMQDGCLRKIPEEQGDWWDISHLQEEPWSLGGGLLPDLQKLIVKTPEVADFFSLKYATLPTAACFMLETTNIEEINRLELYEYFTVEGEKTLCNNDKDFYNQYIAMFEPYYTALNHFVAKEIIPGVESKTCSYFFAISDIISILKTDVDFQQRLGLSNQAPNGLENVPQFAIPFKELSEEFLYRYPSYIDIRWKSEYADSPVCLRRILQCGAATLSLNGSCGCFTMVPATLSDKLEIYLRLGFQRSTLNIPNFIVLYHRL
uniref:O-GlcNAcase n=1 Tax=Panagrolaimus sp. ES5 TaxID=591445 RepID=A0AC34FCD2_9BILA